MLRKAFDRTRRMSTEKPGKMKQELKDRVITMRKDCDAKRNISR